MPWSPGSVSPENQADIGCPAGSLRVRNDGERMAAMKRWLRDCRWLLAGGLVACGAGAPPPQTEGAPAAPPGGNPPPVSSAADVPEAPSTPELLAGIRAFDAGKYSEARKLFEAALHKSPSDATVLYNLGQACEKSGDRAAAESAYKSALERRPDLEAAVEELGALLIDEGRPGDAISLLSRPSPDIPRTAPCTKISGWHWWPMAMPRRRAWSLSRRSESRPMNRWFTSRSHNG